ncbi:MAG: hypothetical protein AAGI10_11750 [Pseudomonadota bacterium]
MSQQDAHIAAQALGQASAALDAAPAFSALPSAEQLALRDRIDRVRTALTAEPMSFAQPDPYETDIFSAPMVGPVGGPQYGYGAPAPAPAPAQPPAPQGDGQTSLLRTVSALPEAAGAMSEELDFASFVSSLVHGTFDAIVDSSIRQMEAFASLVGSLAQTVEDFSSSNVSSNQVRDWLVEKYPADLELLLPRAVGEQPRVLPRGGDDFGVSPAWLADYDLAGETLNEELIETALIPQARLRLGEDRMRTLASMALMGLKRVNVDKGEISARIRIRAKAADTARVGFAQSQDPAQQQQGWSARPGFSAPTAQAMISTAVNAQSDAAIAAELQGEVKVTFSSDSVPLESFVSDAQRVLLERTARTVNAAAPRVPSQPAPSQPAPTQPIPQQIPQQTPAPQQPPQQIAADQPTQTPAPTTDGGTAT